MEKWINFFTKFNSGYYLMIIIKLLYKLGTNPGYFKKVIKILKTLTTE